MSIAYWIKERNARNRERLRAQGRKEGYSLGYGDGYSDRQQGKPPQQLADKAGKSGNPNHIR